MSSKVAFREIARPPIWLVAFIYFLLFSFVIAIWAAFDNQAALISSVLALLLGIFAIHSATTVIEVSSGELKVGRAHIPLRYLKNPTVMSGEVFRRARTRDADPAAYHALIFWISKGIKVEVHDSRDVTPYWLISTKRGAELVRALEN